MTRELAYGKPLPQNNITKMKQMLYGHSTEECTISENMTFRQLTWHGDVISHPMLN